MNKLDKQIEKTKEALNKLVKTKGVLDKSTIQISQELDVLIIRRMRRASA